ncbi:DNA topoisomerase [Clostridium sporogenes]
MSVVVLAEKPDQAKKFAAAIKRGSTPLKNLGGKYEIDTDILGKTIVTWGIGHLVGLSMPEKYESRINKDEFDLKNLPLLPHINEMIYEVQQGKGKQFKVVKECLESADEIIIATDPDREGENIAYNIFKLCKRNIFSKPIKRLWINSLTKQEIQRGFKNLRLAKETESFYYEANARQISDYLVGMNFTELFTVKLREQTGKKDIYSLGRVQTPVNTLVAQNDLEIKNFKPQNYKVIECETIDKLPKVSFKNKNEYFNEADYEGDTKKYRLDNASQGLIEKIEVTNKEQLSPKLFSLGGIQKYANSKWKYSTGQTLKIIQSLYQEGFLSYPRTDCELITTNEFAYLKEHLEEYKTLLGLTFNTNDLEPNKRYVNDKAVLEHYAIIPTTNLPDLTALSEEQRNIYEVITKITCLMFSEPYKYQNTKVILNVNGLIFGASGNVPISLGWKEVEELQEDEKKEEDNNITMPKFNEGEKINIKVNTIDKVTKEPPRLTEGKLVGKGGLMDKLNLGTPATRSSVIDTLLQRGYITLENTKVYPTATGNLLYDLTKDLLIGKPEMTAQWEGYLSKISKKEFTRENFIKNIHKFVETVINQLKEEDFESEFLQASISQNMIDIGNYEVEEKVKVFEVKEKGSNELFVIFKSFSGKQLTLKIVQELLLNGKTKSKIKGLISKEKKKYDAYLVFDKVTKKICPFFEQSSDTCEIKSEKIDKYEVVEKNKVFEIKNTETEEKFIFFKNNSGKIITLSIVKDLLEKGKTDKKIKFLSKNKKTYEAYLIFDENTKQISKSFE